MIIYKDIISDDELMSDTYNIKNNPDSPLLWEIDCKRIEKGADNIQLEGANPSAEEAEDAGGDEGTKEMVLDIQDAFRLVELTADVKPSKDAFKSQLKTYVRKVNEALKSSGASEETIKEFQGGAQAAVKKLLGNFDNYDVYLGSSMEPNGMYVLVDYREDGVTPFATIWKHGLKEMKV
ncbi:hypothetical protein FQN54_001323 [Arachnomyces sp. PD_36]|nr:hypothetical protein FQN54_001323 [Arachnomyces sp. PD_36]